jgi:hypothetical protein
MRKDVLSQNMEAIISLSRLPEDHFHLPGKIARLITQLIIEFILHHDLKALMHEQSCGRQSDWKK